MGFKVQRKGYVLRFAEGTPLHGSQITLGSISIGQVIEVRQMMLAAQQSDSAAESAAGFEAIITMAAERLLGWDLEEEDGTPIPATKAGLMSLDGDLMMPIINAWLDAAKGTDAPLSDASSDGERQALEASIPMEVSSTDLAS